MPSSQSTEITLARKKPSEHFSSTKSTMERLRRVFKARPTEQDGTEMNSSTPRSGGDIVVAVMGLTGVGKSSFIETVSGQKNIVSDSLISGTSAVTPYRFSHDSVNYVLVDTPGFNDPKLSDREVTGRILQWLRSSYQNGTRLNGIIYIDSIAKPRIEGSALKNMHVFRKLCGEDALGNVILATSFWDNILPHVGAERERELATSKEMWGGMIAKGSEVVRIDRNSRSACLQIMERIARKSQVELLVQKDFTVEIDSGADEIRQVKEQLEEGIQSLKNAFRGKMTEGDRAHEKEMKELKSQDERVRREAKENQRRADKEFKRSAKEDERDHRRQMRQTGKGLRPAVDFGERLNAFIPGLYVVACFWNIFITALLGSVVNASGSSPPQINFCMFVAVASWLFSIFGLVSFWWFSTSYRTVIITDSIMVLLTFLAAIILTAMLGVHSCFNETYVTTNDTLKGSPNNRRSCQELQACTAFFWFLFITFCLVLGARVASLRSLGSFRGDLRSYV